MGFVLVIACRTNQRVEDHVVLEDFMIDVFRTWHKEKTTREENKNGQYKMMTIMGR